MNRSIVRHVSTYLVLPIFCCVVRAGAADEAAPPATQPSAAAASLLERVDAAYAKLKSAEFDGHVSGRFDVAGEQKNEDIAFTSTFRAPNRFRHDAKGDALVGSTGDSVFVYEPARNVYMTTDAPKERGSLSDWPRTVADILQQQNPSLLLAVTKSAAGELKDLAAGMNRVADTTVDGNVYPTLQFELPTHQVVTMLIDPNTSLLRQVRYDLRKALEQRGAADVKAAEVTINYTVAAADVAAEDAAFAWSPPPGAVLASANTPSADDGGSASAMVGKPAPDFTLPGLDDKAVRLSSTKGSVVVLDFWATWCGPCVVSLPQLDALYKEQSPKGLKMFAVNQQEEKDTVMPFIEQKKWSVPVLLDSQGSAGKIYGADEGIPITAIIGKDGIVKKVFTGTSDDIELQIKATVERELGQ